MHEKFPLHIPTRFIGAETTLARLVQCVHDLAENIELKLTVRGIADAYGARILVSRQPGNLPFGQPPLAADAIYNLNLLWAAGCGAQQPVAPECLGCPQALVGVDGCGQRLVRPAVL